MLNAAALPWCLCAACGGEFTADSGTLTSPNYPNPYHHNAVCVWTVTVHRRARIDFTVTDIDLERHVNCVWDYIEVADRLFKLFTLIEYDKTQCLN